ncbi:MAG: haloacid dehalogenase [Thermodesulfobacteria bacterium]|nr:haloacid dehalogenase [Thermodesulfobacteriota bacterium]
MIKIKPHQIAFDIDGVVADTMSSFIGIAKKEFGINSIRKEQITSYWLEECLNIPEDIIGAIINRILADPFGTALEPLPGAIETLKLIAQHSPLYFVTARPIREPIEEWLRQKLAGVSPDKIKIEATGQHSLKPQVLKEIGRPYFLEDHLETCHALYEHGLKPIVFDQPWNQGKTPLYRVHGWGELKAMLEL